MTASITDKFMKVGDRGTKTTIESPGKGASDTSITLNNPAGWPTDTAIVFSLYTVDSDTGIETDGSYTIWKGVVVGDQVQQLELLFGANQVYPAGSTAIMHISAPWVSSFIDGLLAAHNQDGSLKDDAVTQNVITDGSVSPAKMSADANVETRMAESLANFVASGLVWSTVSGLSASMTAGVAYVTGKRLAVPAITSYTFTASKDTYVYVDSTGAIQYNSVANNAAQPATPSTSVLVAKVITGAGAITSIVAMPGKPVTSDKVAYETFKNASFCAYLANAQTGANGQAVKLDTKEYDPGNCFSTATFMFTAPVKGLYSFDGAISSATATGVLSALIRTSTNYGNTIKRGAWIAGSGYIISPVGTDFMLDVGDTVLLSALSVNGTATLNASTAADMGNYMCGHLVYPL